MSQAYKSAHLVNIICQNESMSGSSGTVLISVYCALILVVIFQVLSSSVEDALTLLDEDETTETRKLIRLMDKFFDCLNVRNTFHGTTTRYENLHPYTKCNDEQLKVCNRYIYIVMYS